MVVKNKEQTLITHLIELRKRLLNAIMIIFIVFLSLVYFSNEIYQIVSAPLIKQMPHGATMIAINVASPFITPIKLTVIVSLLFSMPAILYQFWAFIAPGLYSNERRLVIPLLFSSSFLFYLGIAFAYFIVFPMIFSFLSKTVPYGVQIAPDINNYLDFIITLFIAFGVSFEIPIAVILLCWTGTTTPEILRSKRSYIFIGTFIIGMLLTPPDIFSQTLLAVPMYFLFELGVFCTRFYRCKKN